LAAAAMISIQRVVEYPSTMPEPGVGSTRPVKAKVREKPRVMAESSHVSGQKRMAMTTWAARAMRTRARDDQSASDGLTFADSDGSTAMWTAVWEGTTVRLLTVPELLTGERIINLRAARRPIAL